MTGSLSDTESSINRHGINVALTWLLLIFIGGFLLIVGLRVLFGNLQEELNARSANERARLFVGEEIVRGISEIEKDLYKIAVTGNAASMRNIRASLDNHLGKLQHDLGVLSQGGTVRREILLNLEGRDQMVSEATYHPAEGNEQYVMELIEIAPLVGMIPDKADTLASMLEEHWAADEARHRERSQKAEYSISSFMKHVPSFFRRLDENANRLFFESSEKLRELERQLTLQHQRLIVVEMISVALVIALAALAGFVVTKRIQRIDRDRELALSAAREAKEEALRASRAKSDFVSRMSHELRTPLNAIIGFAQLLEEEPLPPSQKHFVSLINSSGNHLMELINAVLDHAKIEAGSLTLESIRFDFPAAIEAVRSIVLDKATSKGLDFVAEVVGDLPRYVMGDPTRLRQVLINLLGNSIKFTEKGSIELRVAQDEAWLVFSIRDTGIGMDDETLERLFKPFAQADESITRKFGGTGLGLLISKELIEAMGGHIEVESSVGVGTCFWLRIPLKKADRSDIEVLSNHASGQRESVADLIGGRVLLVDDNRVNLQLGGAMLGKLGLEYDVAVNGLECLEKWASSQYALILMDMEMPEMDGVTATIEIRKAESALADGRVMPIIAMTANALAEDKQRCFAAGMNGYVSKPINFSVLTAEIKRIFPGKPQGDGALSNMPESAIPQAVYDRARVLELLGDEDLLEQLADMFVADAEAHISVLEKTYAERNWPELTRMAHTLKGLFGTFAADAMENDARQLETAAAAQDDLSCGALIPLVGSHVRRLSVALGGG